MISDKSSLASRLGWILDETTLLINQTCADFGTYVESVDTASLDEALKKSRNLLGILDVLEAEGAYMLCREIVLLMDAIQQEKVRNWQDACKTCADGLTLLLDYLKHLHEGYADLPVIVLPTLNNLRAARDAELLSEHLVFLPADGSITNEQIGTSKFIEVPPEKLEEATKKLRFYMQKALLGWFNNDRPEFHLQAAQKVSSNVLVMHQKERLRSLWWVAGALLQALEQRKLEHSVAVKMLMGRMERELKRFGELQEADYNETVPDELLKNLLYYVGLAETSPGQLQAVKEAYHLDLYLPKGETLEELRHYYTLPGRDLWQAVSTSMQDELSVLMSQVESLGRGENPTVLIGDVAKRTNSLAQALGMLGLGKASNLTQALADAQQAVFNQKSEADQALLERMTDHYLKLETLLREYAETGHDRTEEIFFSDSDTLGVGVGATRDVVRGLLTSLSKAQTELAAFHQEPSAFGRLDEIAQILRHIGGTLEVLGHQEIMPLANGVKLLFNKDLIPNKRQPIPAEMNCIADVLTVSEAILACLHRQEDYLPLLSVGYDKLKELDGYTTLDLSTLAAIPAGLAEFETKKKTRVSNASSLYQKLRNQSLLAH
ncbi:hypothetical protein [Thiolinea disciformis]|uniref:hypothetical protein n=1 Tax=Thiolinea disciformis TaxID=125614 RepID=UPI00037C2985|nr:hypothetical protein [Thiolinea disciformis]